jgi:hypothetical protein
MSLEREKTAKHVMRVAFALSLIVTMVAAVAAEDTPDELHDKELRLTEEMVTLVHDSQGNCDVMGDRLGRHISDHAGFLRRAQTAPSAAAERYRARSTAARARMVAGLLGCQTNA